jgi:hypothetical protein
MSKTPFVEHVSEEETDAINILINALSRVVGMQVVVVGFNDGNNALTLMPHPDARVAVLRSLGAVDWPQAIALCEADEANNPSL